MAGRKIFPNRVKVADVMADDYGRKACYQKGMTALSLSLYFYFSLTFPVSNFCFAFLNSASDLSQSKRHSAKKVCP
jgi:hypothetical protein